MKALITLVAISLALCTVSSSIYNPYYYGNPSQQNSNNGNQQGNPNNYVPSFQEFQVKFRKSYPSENVRNYRKGIYQANVKEVIRNNNDPNKKYTKSVTKFMDMTKNEFKRVFLNLNFRPERKAGSRPNKNRGQGRRLQTNYVDWTQYGFVTPVRDQGYCGSCWAFSASAVIESGMIMYENASPSIHISEQQQVNCVYNYDGCEGGFQADSYKYAMKKGISSGSSVPYVGYAQRCNVDSGIHKIQDYVMFYNEGCSTVLNELQWGPLSVAVNADNWFDVGSDVFPYERAGEYDLNHAVLLVGYVQTSQGPAWKIKNSWGREWGDNGYIYLAYGRDGNNCGVCIEASYTY